MKFCSLASGSGGNSQYVGSRKAGLLIDAGTSGKYITQSLAAIDVDPLSIRGLLITHEHSDHIKGAGIIARKLNIPIIGTAKTLEAVASTISLNKVETKTIEKGRIYDINFQEVSEIREEEAVYFKCFEISHDAVDPVGYSLYCNESKISLLTDTGMVSSQVEDEVRDSDFLMLEANHDVEMLKVGSYPFYLKQRILSEIGHLSNDTAASTACRAVKGGKLKGILLGHLSRENNFPELAYQTVAVKLREQGIEPGEDIRLDLAQRDRISSFITLG